MIYTRGGDKGMTSLAAGGRTAKNSPLVEAYGTIDELNAITGFLHDTLATETLDGLQEVREKLHRVQRELFDISSEIAALQKITDEHKVLTQQSVKRLEQEIDAWTSELPQLRNFILPAGHRLSSLGHVCRTVCRRAERAVCALRSDFAVRDEIIAYLNRLSDWFFTIGRYILYLLQIPAEIWTRTDQD